MTPRGILNDRLARLEELRLRLEKLAVQRERNRLKALVRTIPTYHEDGMWVKHAVLGLIDETTTPSAQVR